MKSLNFLFIETKTKKKKTKHSGMGHDPVWRRGPLGH